MEKLKPCPFCEEIESVWVTVDIYGQNFEVVCDRRLDGCGATGGERPTKGGAIEAWNRRADDNRPDKPELTVGQTVYRLTDGAIDKIKVFCTTPNGFIIDGDGSEMPYSHLGRRWFLTKGNAEKAKEN